MSWMMTVYRAASAGRVSPARSVTPMRRACLDVNLSCHRLGDLFGMLLVRGEEREPLLQQGLEFGILRVGDQRILERAIDGLVIGHFILDVGPVELGARQLVQLSALG